MSRYGEDGDTGYAKEELYDAISSFLNDHMISELMNILADVIRDKFEAKGRD